MELEEGRSSLINPQTAFQVLKCGEDPEGRLSQLHIISSWVSAALLLHCHFSLLALTPDKCCQLTCPPHPWHIRETTPESKTDRITHDAERREMSHFSSSTHPLHSRWLLPLAIFWWRPCCGGCTQCCSKSCYIPAGWPHSMRMWLLPCSLLRGEHHGIIKVGNTTKIIKTNLKHIMMSTWQSCQALLFGKFAKIHSFPEDWQLFETVLRILR